MTSIAPDTFPKLLLEHARLRPDRPANREKDYGIWQSWTWAQVAAEVITAYLGVDHVRAPHPLPPASGEREGTSGSWAFTPRTCSVGVGG